MIFTIEVVAEVETAMLQEVMVTMVVVAIAEHLTTPSALVIETVSMLL